MIQLELRRSILPSAFCAGLGLAALCFWMSAHSAKADDLSGFSVMLQRGDTTHPEAIVIAPNGQWFLTAHYGSQIYLSDLASGAVLRMLEVPGRPRRVAISKDGHSIYTRYISNEGLDEEPEMVVGWDAETGLPIAQAEAMSPAQDDPSWNWIDKPWEGTHGLPPDLYDPKRYLFDQKIDHLVDVERVQRIEPTNRRNIVQVTVRGETPDDDEFFASSYRYYFIDVIQKKMVVEVSGKTLNRICGEPHGAFAFNGRYLIIAPTELDASSSFINSIVIDTTTKPPTVKWSRPCQDYQVASMSTFKGMIVVSPSPDKLRIWNPATARLLASLDDIQDSNVLNWSHDLTTFATGFHEAGSSELGPKYGVSVLRSGKKLFIPTLGQVNAINLSPNGSVVFALTQAGWSSWSTSNGASLPLKSNPPPDDYEAGSELIHSALKAGWFLVASDTGGKERWIATANNTNGDDFLFIKFPDGRVRLSKSAESMVKVVRGFEVRPFDAAARRAFVYP